MITPAEARAIVERHRPLSDGRCDECGQHWQCDAHASATAYLASVADDERLRAALLKVYDAAVDRSDIRRIARAALADVAGEETP